MKEYLSMEIQDLPKITASKQDFSCPFFTVRYDSLQHPGDGSSEYYVIEFPTVAAVIAEHEGNFLFVSQYRHPIRERTIEFPMGRVDKHELIEEAANRELQEESGFRANSLTRLFALVSFVGQADHHIEFFLAKDLVESTKQADPGEYNLTTQWMSPEEIDDAITQGIVNHSETIAAWYKFKLTQK